jgi:hypothetical protein
MRRYVNLENIEGIMYGPQSYTFRAYKMHFLIKHFLEELRQEKKPSDEVIMLASPAFNKEFERMSFANKGQEMRVENHNKQNQEIMCWECVSLKLYNRTIDFVIHNEQDMLIFLEAIS